MLDFSKLPIGTKVKDGRGVVYTMGDPPLPHVSAPLCGMPGGLFMVRVYPPRGRSARTFNEYGARLFHGATPAYSLTPYWLELPPEKAGQKPHDLSFLPPGTTFVDGYGIQHRIAGYTPPAGGDWRTGRINLEWRDVSGYWRACDMALDLRDGVVDLRADGTLENARRCKSDAVLKTVVLPGVLMPATTPSAAAPEPMAAKVAMPAVRNVFTLSEWE